jgi:hypothetical protein
MKRTLVRFSKVFAVLSGLGVLGAMSFSSQAAQAQEYDYPPAEYIATAEPVYYEGHSSYWYNNRWYYRDGGGRWGYYHGEPGYLHDWRGRPGWGGRYHYGNGGFRGGYHGGGYHGGGGHGGRR